MARYGRDYRRREFSMDPGWAWDDHSDPNWRHGTYHGLRMGEGPWHAAYGRHRLDHEGDLGGHGGFDGRYDLEQGWFDSEGIYHEARGHRRLEPRYARDYDPRWEERGGVRDDREYLRQYNAHSPALGRGGPDRSWGFSEGPDAPRMLGRDARGRRTDERRYSGYNTGGFSEGKFPGPGTRGSAPQR
jgi:hypothetical protein